MSGLKYILNNNNLGGKKNYLPQTILSLKCNKKDVIRRLSLANNGFTMGQYEHFFRDLESVAAEIIREGGSLMIGDFIRIKPVIKGSFDNLEEPFSLNKQRIDIVASVDSNFIKETTEGMSASRAEKRAANRAELKEVTSDSGRNILCPFYFNSIRGNNLLPAGATLTGLTLKPIKEGAQPLFVSIESLKIATRRPKELTFCFHRNFTLPAELSEVESLMLTLNYRHDEDGRPVKSGDLLVRVAAPEDN